MKKILAGIGLFFLTGQICFAQPDNFISLADIHFNPFAGCGKQKPCELAQRLQKAPWEKWRRIFINAGQPIADYDHDSNFALLKSTIEQTRTLNAQDPADFIFVLGDFLGHNFLEKYVAYTQDTDPAHYQAFVRKTFYFLQEQFMDAFPETPMVFVIGNNDSYGGDYAVQLNGSLFADLANSWQRALRKLSHQTFNQTFKYAGYYAVDLDNHNKILVLDSVIFSSRDTRKLYHQAATEEFKWLQQQLAETEKNKGRAIIAMHIPPGKNIYSMIGAGPVEYWRPEYAKQFQTILDNYKNTITTVLAGHIHVDSMGVVNFPHPKEIVFSYTPSISPIFGNNPSFKTYEYNPLSLRLKKYETYYLSLNSSFENKEWKQEFHFGGSF